MEFEQLDKKSKVWVYQADRALNQEEQTAILNKLNHFTETWVSHGEELNATATIVENHFVVLGLSPTQGKLCGGAVDSSFREIKAIGNEMNIDFFNRLKVVTKEEDGNHEYIHFSELENHKDRTTFNVMISTKEEFDTAFELKVGDYLELLMVR